MDSDFDSSPDGVVLYVEDQSVNVFLMEMLFERLAGPRLVSAMSGEEALCIAPRIQPSLLLLDVRLPDCQGPDLLVRLRKLPAYRDIPAIAVTAESDFFIEGTSFSEIWRKPLDVAWVMSRLAHWCERPRHGTGPALPRAASAARSTGAW